MDSQLHSKCACRVLLAIWAGVEIASSQPTISRMELSAHRVPRRGRGGRELNALAIKGEYLTAHKITPSREKIILHL